MTPIFHWLWKKHLYHYTINILYLVPTSDFIFAIANANANLRIWSPTLPLKELSKKIFSYFIFLKNDQKLNKI